ncbi:MAG: MATE family efflux transporter [Treponema sp.]|nr:MATE family efflux transporter [Treponema sp.]
MKNTLSDLLQSKKQITLSQQLSFVWKLSIPAILAQLSSILMQYIDAAMVGNLGAEASASIGIVSTSMWLIYGIGYSVGTGFSVQVAQAVGAGDIYRTKQTVREALIFMLIFSVITGSIALIISPWLPVWLGASKAIQQNASDYFRIFALSQPAVMLCSVTGAMLECSGNMKVPSILNASKCILDVLFNAIFIFPSRYIQAGSYNILLPGFGLEVKGAAIGTALSQIVICICMMLAALRYSPHLKLTGMGSWKLTKKCMNTVRKISLPMTFEQIALCGAQIAMTSIVAPLGTVSLAADSFGVTAESLCYMPGYGIQSAATTLVGQSIGAGKERESKRFAWLTVTCGMVVMAMSAIIMYAACPAVFHFLTPDNRVQELGIKVLRIEMLAEPLFGASIVASGALRGIGDTLVPGIMTLVSIWGVRLTLGKILSSRLGLTGVWIAMCAELSFRGMLMLIRLSASPHFKLNKPSGK